MAPTKRSGKKKAPEPSSVNYGSPPTPFKPPPEVLHYFISQLDEKHIYITHIDSKPASFKRKIFVVPVLMNFTVTALFFWRMSNILPWYWKLLMSGFGNPNETTFPFAESTWSELFWEIWKRAIVMFIDFMLFVFVWPWPVEFAFGQKNGNPALWRIMVGFRDQEIYVRRSRDWDQLLKDITKDSNSWKVLLAQIRKATNPSIQEQKTGYLLMNGEWDLDWYAMIRAHKYVDNKNVALEAFKNIVLVHHQDYGWMCYDIKTSISSEEDEKRRQVFAFRDALTAMGKEDIFYRWIEIVQFESTQPGGFGTEKQEAAAKKIRDLFEGANINFDELWQQTVGTDAGMK